MRRLAGEYEAKYRAKGDTGGAAIGELVLVVPQAKKRDGKVKPGEFGNFVEKKDNGTLIIETLSHDSKEKNETTTTPLAISARPRTTRIWFWRRRVSRSARPRTTRIWFWWRRVSREAVRRRSLLLSTMCIHRT